MACCGVYGSLEYLGEGNGSVFRGRERDPCEVWPLAKFHVSLWASALKLYCNYTLGNFW